MRTPQEVQRARALIGLTRDFLLDKSKEGSEALTFEFQVGALTALEWMLDTSGADPFDSYLVSLESMHQAMIAGRS